MVEVKSNELALARNLHVAAYEPVRAAQGTLARVLTIVTSVIAMFVARLILEPLGL